jgi:hypothetical protein
MAPGTRESLTGRTHQFHACRPASPWDADPRDYEYARKARKIKPQIALIAGRLVGATHQYEAPRGAADHLGGVLTVEAQLPPHMATTFRDLADAPAPLVLRGDDDRPRPAQRPTAVEPTIMLRHPAPQSRMKLIGLGVAVVAVERGSSGIGAGSGGDKGACGRSRGDGRPGGRAGQHCMGLFSMCQACRLWSGAGLTQTPPNVPATGRNVFRDGRSRVIELPLFNREIVVERAGP